MHEELIRKIEEAFAEVPYPGDDNFGHIESEILIGQEEWQKVPPELTLRFGGRIFLLAPESFQFYLPAFLSAALRYPREFSWSDTLVFSMTPKVPHADYKNPAEWALPLFTSAQKSAVVEFLETYPELYPGDAYAVLENDKAELQRAIQFWQEN